MRFEKYLYFASAMMRSQKLHSVRYLDRSRREQKLRYLFWELRNYYVRCHPRRRRFSQFKKIWIGACFSSIKSSYYLHSAANAFSDFWYQYCINNIWSNFVHFSKCCFLEKSGLTILWSECNDWPLHVSVIMVANPLTAKLFYWNFYPPEVVSRWRDPQLQVDENIQIWQNRGQRFWNIAVWCPVLSLPCLKADM